MGLTIDDFTRAVVLPQGKFAEFLSLKGAERRHMLQRLFNLEQYGDRLVKKLRRQAQEANARKNEMLAEQSGLGEASSEAVEQAEQALEQAEARLEAMKKNRDQAKERFTEHQEIWNVQRKNPLTKKRKTSRRGTAARRQLAKAPAGSRNSRRSEALCGPIRRSDPA